MSQHGAGLAANTIRSRRARSPSIRQFARKRAPTRFVGGLHYEFVVPHTRTSNEIRCPIFPTRDTYRHAPVSSTFTPPALAIRSSSWSL